ncbi:MAG: hypothetical protein WC636_02310, partial [Candidatus Margulisiibacteriota bacterium]
RVDWTNRGKKRLRIFGGTSGKTFECYVRSRHFMLRVAAKFLRPFYRFFSRTKILAKTWPAAFSPKLVTYHHHGIKEQQLLLGPLVIGRKFAGKKWRIRAPFKLLVDEQKLLVP